MTVDRSRRRWLAAVPGLAATGLAVGAASDPATRPLIEWPALSTVHGERVDAESWRDRPAVVVFWATWCPFCHRHNARLDKLERSLDGRRMRVLGVAMDRDPERVRRYLDANHWSFATVLDQGRLRPRFTERGVIPMTCIVDRHGRLQQSIPGEMAESDLLELARLALPATR